MIQKFFKYKLVFSRRMILKIAVFLGAISISKLLLPKNSSSKEYLRLPGAEDKVKFLTRCIKCGQCVQVCPYNSVTLLDIKYGLEMGTPAIFPEKRGCYLCDLLPCVLSCPSGALNHDISSPKEVKMGKAEVIFVDNCYGKHNRLLSEDDVLGLVAHGTDSETERELADKLLNYIGKKCTICFDFCPYPDSTEAIELVYSEGAECYPSILEKCVGCGVCVELCPAKQSVFTINIQ